ncbi:hypothetical protein STCU_11046 [Strigomonas culicis]|uniref:Uncharacterized protein n=1 Tax=Strigomonas culicis TaxID=28005 RepID=S9UQ06_9TRYP|nr:hypothetical protein STCU_11046 [Strigomonas culicis]|eukprot:EPY16711.1 hypothetical protein STCU_11046 [Strigomonas culicis]
MQAEDPESPKAEVDAYEMVDYTYYPTSSEEESATLVLRQYLSTGIMSRDVVKARRRQPKGVSHKLREKLRAELEQRRKDKEARMRKKAQSDTAARAAADAKLRHAAAEALKREKAAAAADTRNVVKRPVNIRRYPIKNDLKDFNAWRAEGKRIAQHFVKVDHVASEVHIANTLETDV